MRCPCFYLRVKKQEGTTLTLWRDSLPVVWWVMVPVPADPPAILYPRFPLSPMALIIEVLIAVHLHVCELNELVDVLDVIIAATGNAHRDAHLRNHATMPARCWWHHRYALRWPVSPAWHCRLSPIGAACRTWWTMLHSRRRWREGLRWTVSSCS